LPSLVFVWLELVAHHSFMSKILRVQKGWVHYQIHIVSAIEFMSPSLRSAELTPSLRLMYKGLLRLLLVLLHDFPEFLCDYHYNICDVVPATCIQIRNLILSAFPRNMRLPNPFTPNLKVDRLPEISSPPQILPNFVNKMQEAGLRPQIDAYLNHEGNESLLEGVIEGLRNKSKTNDESSYNIPAINSLVLYVGTRGINALGKKDKTNSQIGIAQTLSMNIFKFLVTKMDTEGRYYVVNAMVNQVRFPNNQTHYFSCVLLYLFAETNGFEIVQEQITRVLVERLIAARPHPWGLLITFIELIKNPKYKFWSYKFVFCAPEIKSLFDSVHDSVKQSLMYSQQQQRNSQRGQGNTGPTPNPNPNPNPNKNMANTNSPNNMVTVREAR